MSDQIANLEIKVNVTSIKGAMQALDGLVAKADQVEKRQTKAAEEGGKKRISAQERELRAAEKTAKAHERLLKDQEKIEVQTIAKLGRMRSASLSAQERTELSYMNRMAAWRARAYKEQERQQAQAMARQERLVAAATRRAAAQQIALERALQSSTSSFSGIQNRANRQLGSAEASVVITQARRAMEEYQTTLRRFGAGSVEAVRAQGTFARAIQQSSSEIARQGGLLRTVNDNARTVSAAFGAANASLGGFGRLVFSTNAALAALAGTLGLREITQSIMEFERFTNTLRTVSGSVGQFQQNLSFLFAEANRIGFSVGEVGNSFARLSLAMQGAGFTGEQTRTTFTQLAEASRNFGLSSADTMGVIRALEQSMSKGKFMAEEVRLQMGDRLPIAMAALTRAVEKVDGAQVDINKRFEEGTLDVARYGAEFIRQINLMSGGAETLARTQNSLAAAFGRLGTEFTQVTSTLGEGGFSNAVIIATGSLTELLAAAREYGVVDTLGASIEVMSKNLDLLVGVVAALAAAGSIKLLIGLFAAFNPVVLAVAAALGALGAAFVYFNRNVQDSAREVNASLNSLDTALDRVRGNMENVDTMLRRGAPETNAAATRIDRMATAYTRLGLSAEEAMRRVAAAEARDAQRQLATEQRNLTGARGDFQTLISRASGVSEIRNRAAQANALAASARAGVGNRVPAGQLPAEVRANEIARITNIIGEVQNRAIPVEDAIIRLIGLFEAGNIPREVQRIIDSFNDLAGSPEYQALVQRLETAESRIASFTEQMRDAQQIAANGAVFRMYVEAIQMPDGVGGGGLVRPNAGGGLTAADAALAEALRGAGSPRTRLAAIRSAAARPDLAGLFEGVDLAGRDTDVLARLRSNPRFGVLSESLGVLNEAAPQGRAAGGGGNGARNAVAELMDDLARQAQRAPAIAGAAQEIANAQDRIRDAARNANQEVGIAVELERARILVLERLNNEFKAYEEETLRAVQANDRLSAAFAQGSEAGRQAELTQRAYVEAARFVEPELDAAGNATGRYAEAVARARTTVDQLSESERRLAAQRQSAENRSEIEVLELERQLVMETVEFRETEIALLRARQQYGEQFTPELEASIRALGTTRARTEQVRNSWDELARSGERAFETIGDAITEAFAKGEISSIKFGNIARAVMSSVAQTALRMAIINPMLNAIFGGTRATIGGLVDGAGGGEGGGGGMGILGQIGQLSGLSNLLPSGGFSGISASINGWGASMFPGVFGGVGPATSTALGAMGPGVFGPATPSAVAAAGGGLPTLMGTVGGIGGGFAIGSLIGGMVAGNSPARQLNSKIGAGGGALAGAAIGSIVPGVGTVLGALIGGGLGGAGGGLLGPKKGFSGGDAILGTDEAGRLFVDRGVGKKFDTQGLVNQVTPEVARVNTIMEQAGLRFATGLFAAVGGGESGNPKTVEEALAHWGGLSGITSNNSRVQTALNTVRPDSFEGIIAIAQEAVALSEVLDNINKPTNQFSEALKELHRQFDEQSAVARRLGFGEAELAAERQKQVDLLLSQRQETLQQISDEIKIRGWRVEGKNAMADELEAAMNRKRQIKELNDQLEQMGYTAEEIAPFIENYGNLIDRETRRVFTDLQTNIKGFLDSLKVNDLGGYSAPDRLMAARTQYDAALGKARLGDKEALGNITGYAETLLSVARENFASSAQWKAMRDYIQMTLGELSVTKFAKGGIPDVVGSPTIAPMAMFGEGGRSEAIIPLRRMSNGDLGVAMGGGMGSVVAAINGLRMDNEALREEVVALRKEVGKNTARTAEAAEDTADSNRRMVTQAPRERVGARS